MDGYKFSDSETGRDFVVALLCENTLLRQRCSSLSAHNEDLLKQRNLLGKCVEHLQGNESKDVQRSVASALTSLREAEERLTKQSKTEESLERELVHAKVQYASVVSAAQSLKDEYAKLSGENEIRATEIESEVTRMQEAIAEKDKLLRSANDQIMLLESQIAGYENGANYQEKAVSILHQSIVDEKARADVQEEVHRSEIQRKERELEDVRELLWRERSDHETSVRRLEAQLAALQVLVKENIPNMGDAVLDTITSTSHSTRRHAERPRSRPSTHTEHASLRRVEENTKANVGTNARNETELYSKKQKPVSKAKVKKGSKQTKRLSVFDRLSRTGGPMFRNTAS